jgi:hypothetical protein
MRMAFIYLTLKMLDVSFWSIKLDVAGVTREWWFLVFHIGFYTENGVYYMGYLGWGLLSVQSSS